MVPLTLGNPHTFNVFTRCGGILAFKPRERIGQEEDQLKEPATQQDLLHTGKVPLYRDKGNEKGSYRD